MSSAIPVIILDDVVIEKNVPVHRSPSRAKWAKIFRKMEDGDSFVIKMTSGNTSSIYGCARNQGLKAKIRRLDNSGNYRIWIFKGGR